MPLSTAVRAAASSRSASSRSANWLSNRARRWGARARHAGRASRAAATAASTSAVPARETSARAPVAGSRWVWVPPDAVVVGAGADNQAPLGDAPGESGGVGAAACG